MQCSASVQGHTSLFGIVGFHAANVGGFFGHQDFHEFGEAVFELSCCLGDKKENCTWRDDLELATNQQNTTSGVCIQIMWEFMFQKGGTATAPSSSRVLTVSGLFLSVSSVLSKHWFMMGFSELHMVCRERCFQRWSTEDYQRNLRTELFKITKWALGSQSVFSEHSPVDTQPPGGVWKNPFPQVLPHLKPSSSFCPGTPLSTLTSFRFRKRRSLFLSRKPGRKTKHSGCSTGASRQGFEIGN